MTLLFLQCFLQLSQCFLQRYSTVSTQTRMCSVLFVLHGVYQRRSSRPPNPPIGGAQANFGAQVSLKLLFGYVTIFSSADLFTTDLNCRKKLACDIISEFKKSYDLQYLLTSCNTEERIAQNIYIHNSNRNIKKSTTRTILIKKRIGIGYILIKIVL